MVQGIETGVRADNMPSNIGFTTRRVRSHLQLWQPKAKRLTDQAEVAQQQLEQAKNPWWQKPLEAFAWPFEKLQEHVATPIAAAITSPFWLNEYYEKNKESLALEGITSKDDLWTKFPGSGDVLLQPGSRTREAYESWEAPWGVKGALEIAPWFAIPGIGGVAGRAGGIAGKLGKLGAAGKVAGRALEYSPWGLAEKGAGKALGAAGKGISKLTGKAISKLEGNVLLDKMMDIKTDSEVAKRIYQELVGTPLESKALANLYKRFPKEEVDALVVKVTAPIAQAVGKGVGEYEKLSVNAAIQLKNDMGTLANTGKKNLRRQLGEGTEGWNEKIFNDVSQGKDITVYRVVPKNIKSINVGDRVTHTFESAQKVMDEMYLPNEAHILSVKANPSELVPQIPNEFIWVPKAVGKGVTEAVPKRPLYTATEGAIPQTVKGEENLTFIEPMTRSMKFALDKVQEQAKLYKKELSPKFATVQEIQMQGKGTVGVFEQARAMKNELEKIDFEIPKELQMTTEQADEAINYINANMERFSTPEKMRAGIAINKLAGLWKDPVTGKAARIIKSDLTNLGDMFPQLRPMLKAYQSMGDKAWGNFVDAANIPRALLSSGDFSVTFRQLALALSRSPQHLSGVLRTQMRVVFNPKNYDDLMDGIMKKQSVRDFMEEGGLYMAGTPGKTEKLWMREEQFQSNMAERIPYIGGFIRASERAFMGGANYMRGQMADGYANMLRHATSTNYRKLFQAHGVKDATALEAKVGAGAYKQLIKDANQYTKENITSLSRIINASTGRGDLPKSLKEAAPFINAMFFSPRFVMSRLQLPAMMLSGNPYARKEAIRTMVQFMAIGSGVVGMASMAGAKVQMNPLSSDFGKIKVGNTRLDIWSGYTQWSRLIAQLITNERITTTTGEKQKLNRLETVARFLQSKGSPIMGLIVDSLAGQNYLGEPMFEGGWETLGREARNRLVFMTAQDILDAIETDGLLGGGIAGPSAFFGVGVSSYKQKPSLSRRRIGTSRRVRKLSEL